LYARIRSRLSIFPLHRITLGITLSIARRHPRASLAVATAAAAGLLGASGYAIGTAPWAQEIGSVAMTMPGGPQSAPLRLGTPLFEAIAGVAAHGGKTAGGGQLDDIGSAVTAGGTSAPAAAHGASTGKQTAVHQAPRRQATQRQVARQQAVQRLAATRLAAKSKAAAVAAKPYRIYDSVLPGSIPTGKAAAVYANGAYKASSAQLAGHHSVLWIDTNGSDPAANVLDVEPGDATPSAAARWARKRLSSQPNSVAIVYTMKSEWQQVKANMAALPTWMRSKIRYWIADPTGVPHVVAGASATQWYWGSSYDITTANPSFVR